MDVFDKKKRSWIMSRVKGVDTSPERKVRSIVHRLGFRFRLHRRDLPGVPDMVLPKYRKIIFVHGCFWHGHKGCRRAERPSSNRAFWGKKLDRNIERDKKNKRALIKEGWSVLVVWECQTKDPTRLTSKIEKFLTIRKHNGQPKEKNERKRT